FRLLEARPPLARLLGDVLSLAPTLADMLARRPALIDGLIDASALDPPPDVAGLAKHLATAAKGADYEGLLDCTRQEGGELRFAQGGQIAAGAEGPLRVAGGCARIAGAAVGGPAAATVAEFEAAHGRVPGGELIV